MKNKERGGAQSQGAKIVTEILGWYGTVVILAAYALVSFGIFKADGLWAQLLNFTGALGIVTISLNKKAYQPAVLNGTWALIAIVVLARLAFLGSS